MSGLSWIEIALKEGFQPDKVSGALICTPAVIENFARAVERETLEFAANMCDGFASRLSWDEYPGSDVDCYPETAERCARMIRSLTGK